MAETPPELDLAVALESWILHLRAERKSLNTITTYAGGVRAYLRWCAGAGCPPAITRDAAVVFIADIVQSGRSATTAQARHMALSRFSAWLLAEKITDGNPLAGLKPPKTDEPIIDPLTDDECRALIKACDGERLMDRRDEAIVRFMIESPTRATEVATMLLSDVDVSAGTAVMRRTKGGKTRIVGFSPFTARAIDRYLRLRRRHKLAATDRLWLGARSNTFGYDGLYFALGKRADAAGIVDFHPHRLRHTSADRWLGAGGSEGGLMAVAGWESYEMLRRYTRRRSNVRAIEESRRLNLGDL